MLEPTRNLHIIMLIGAACGLESMYYNCIYNTTLCECDDVLSEINCVGLQEIPPLHFERDEPYYKILSLEEGNITSIMNGSLPPDLRGLFISGHPLSNISDDAFDNIATTLTYLDISGAKFVDIPRAMLNLPILKSLSIADTPIRDWNDSVLYHLSRNITSLYLNNVRLFTWPSWISNFHLLRNLDLSGNLLNSVPDKVFSSCKDSLTELNLGSTGLTHVPQALSILTSLTSLNLSDNKFVDLSELENPALFPNAARVSGLTLYLRSVGLTRIVNFSNMTVLKAIYLDNNNISDYTAGFFPPTVTEVSLVGNQLSSVPVAVSMSSLKYLDLSENRISEITTGSLPTTINTLLLSFNKFTTITNTTLTNLTDLTWLDLSNNPISTISPKAFAHLSSLQHLDLDYTNLTEIPLALTRLYFSIQNINLENIPSLSCQCPIPTELNTWYHSKYRKIFSGVCKNGEEIDDYFMTNCGVTASSTSDTTTKSQASGPGWDFWSKCCSVVVLLLYYLIGLE